MVTNAVECGQTVHERGLVKIAVQGGVTHSRSAVVKVIRARVHVLLYLLSSKFRLPYYHNSLDVFLGVNTLGNFKRAGSLSSTLNS